jgi:hypothetical protein
MFQQQWSGRIREDGGVADTENNREDSGIINTGCVQVGLERSGLRQRLGQGTGVFE